MLMVLDTSVSLTWLLHNGTSQQTDLADRVLDHLESNPNATLAVPNLWWLEWANAVSRAQRRSLVSPQQITEYADLVASLSIQTLFTHPDDVVSRILPLAIRTGLTTYDATYLDLAMELKAPLATADQALYQAATKLRVQTL